MNNNPETPKWKKALKWLALVVLDWLLDGRLRKRMPGKRRAHGDTMDILLSGFVSPVDNMPGWLQDLTWINPLRHFIPLVKGVFLKNIGWSAVIRGWWPLLVIAAATSLGANWIFRRRFAA